MGLFDIFKKKPNPAAGKTFRNEIERDMYINNTMGYRDTKDHLDYQNDLLSRVNAAQARYKEDGDLNAVIKELEYAFIEADPPCATSQNMSLADYYIKAGMRDKAWSYLNRLQYTNQAPLEKIRFAQARILKKENKHIDAIHMMMLGHLAKSQWNNTFHKDMFIKDIQPSANKLKWEDDKREYLAYLVESQVKAEDYDESQLTSKYQKFVREVTQ